MISYASRTGTKRNLDGLRKRGFRLLISATGAHRDEGFTFAIDNGEWTRHAAKAKKWKDPRNITRAFIRLMLSHGDRADWGAAPDIVRGGLPSLARSLKWLPWMLDHCPRVLIPVQDGMTLDDIERLDLLGDRVGIFVGGGDGFKEKTVGAWAHLARKHGAWCHVGRVNSVRRIAICAAAGVTSFDGTNGSMFEKQQPKLHRARVQGSLLVEPTSF